MLIHPVIRGSARRILLSALAISAAVTLAGSHSTVPPETLVAEREQADALYTQEKWEAARAVYDRIVARSRDRFSKSTLDVLERAVECSLRLGDADDALRRATEFRRESVDRDRTNWRPSREARRDYLQFLRRLFETIRKESDGAPPAFASKLARQQIAANFDLIGELDPEADDTWRGIWHSEMNWWWEGVAEAQSFFGQSSESAFWFGPDGIPLDADGQPIYLEAAAESFPAHGRGLQVLYLLAEIERLDPSQNKDHAARARLIRSRLMQRLYGPETDPIWQNGFYYYRFDRRPDFTAAAREQGLKPHHELADDEVRTLVGHRLRVLRLPDAQNPLSLLRRIESDFPRSRLVAEAIYEQALYHQSRRQFSRALDEYGRLLERFPDHRLSKLARRQTRRIKRADVLLGQTSVFATGRPVKLWFSHRNVRRVDFRARPFDLKAWLNRADKNAWYGALDVFDRWSDQSSDDEAEWKAFAAPVAHQWTEEVQLSTRVSVGTTEAPQLANGAWVIEARIPDGESVSRGLVIVSSVALVEKHLGGEGLLWLVDARTGHPLPNQTVEVSRRRGRNAQERSRQSYTTGADGLVRVPPLREDDWTAIADLGERGLAVHPLPFMWSRGGTPPERIWDRGAILTDRPAYRPGSTVQFRAWIRRREEGGYALLPSGSAVTAELSDPEGQTYKTIPLQTDSNGSVTGSFELGREVRLGAWLLNVQADDADYGGAWARIQLEEYRKPEFTVTVSPQPVAGEPGAIRARVEARYYFGGPVSGGTVDYSVVRTSRSAPNTMPREFDWLYGPGYGSPRFAYPWLGDRPNPGAPLPDPFFDGWYDPESIAGEFVTRGRVELDGQGTAQITIDTSHEPPPAAGNAWEYIIEAHVRDESRRAVAGRGSVRADVQPFVAVLEADRGWYSTGETAAFELRTHSVDGLPISQAGKVTLSSIRFLDEQRTPEQTTIAEWSVKTDEAGTARVEARLQDPGLYRVVYSSTGEAGPQVGAALNVWTRGENLGGNVRCAPLELIPDRRTYRVGETARLLINSDRHDAHVLLWDSFDQYRIVEIPRQSQVVEISIQQQHVPDSLVWAALVRDGQLHTGSCALYVPPVDKLLSVAVVPAQETLRPGETGRVRIQVTAAAGRPVRGDVALTAYDKAVTVIAEEDENAALQALLGSRSRTAYSGERDPYCWEAEASASVGQRLFDTSGHFVCPEFHLRGDGSFSGGFGGGGFGGGFDGPPPEGGDPATHEPTLSLISGQRASLVQAVHETSGAVQLLRPAMRREFADTAVWRPRIALDEKGTAEVDVPFPESLTTWRIRVQTIDGETRIGRATAEVTTTKNLLVRLQAPRFLVEGDRVTLSANVHNRLTTDKHVTAALRLPAQFFRPLGEASRDIVADADGSLRLTATHLVKSGAERRFDWPVLATADGDARIVAEALTEEESDAVERIVPVRARGLWVQVAHSESFPADERAKAVVPFELPESIDPAGTRLQLTLAVSPAVAAFEAIPFLGDYPYGCVEQTLSRFYPTVLAAHTLKTLGTDLDSLNELLRKRGLRGTDRHWAARVTDSQSLSDMTEEGLQRLYRFQHADGGWGWWEHDASSIPMTAYVVLGLHTAAQAGAPVRDSVYDAALEYLVKAMPSQEAGPASSRGSLDPVFAAYVMSLPRPSTFGVMAADERRRIRDAVESLLSSAGRSNALRLPGDQALLALTYHGLGKAEQAAAEVDELLRSVEIDRDSDTAWLEVPAGNSSSSWDSDVEANAWALRAVLAIRPEHVIAAQLANGLAARRQNGRHWRSTRDTALAVTALAEYLASVRRRGTDARVDVAIDDRPSQMVAVEWDDLLGSEIVFELRDLGAGQHSVSLQKSGRAPVHAALTVDYFHKPDPIPPASRGISIERRFWLCRDVADARSAGVGDRSGGPSAVRSPLQPGDAVKVGELVDVELTISAEEDYNYLAFEDAKPAGCEPVQLHSGGTWGDGLWANVELRDEKVVFFAGHLARGRHVLQYRLRAETPGEFRVLPARGFAMYAPEIHARSTETRMLVEDEPQPQAARTAAQE